MTTIAVTRVAANTSTGNQSITTSDLGGIVPSAALFICNRSIVNNTSRSEATVCIGAATSTTQRWAMFSTSQDALANTNVTRRGMTDQCIAIPFAGGTIDGEADFVSFITNGVTINWTNAPGNAYLVTVVLFANISGAYAGTFAPGTSVGSAVDVTAPNFQPDVVFLAATGDTFNDTGTSAHSPSWGWAIRDGSNSQRCILQSEADGVAVGTPRAYLSTAYGVANLDPSTNNLLWAGEIGSFDSQGFSCTLRVGSAGTDDVGYLAINLNGASVWTGTHTTPTATGNQSSTAPGFQPQVLFLGMTHLTSTDTGVQSNDAGAFAMWVTTSTAQYSYSTEIQNGSATTSTECLSRNWSVDIDNHDHTTGIEATLVSLDTNGWTLNFSDTLAAARNFIVLAISTGGGGGGDSGGGSGGTAPVYIGSTGGALYEIWLCDAYGNLLDIIDDWVYLQYNRALNNIGTLELGLDGGYPNFSYIKLDGRIIVWRNGEIDTETCWLIRRVIRTLDETGLRGISLGAVSANEIINRRIVAYDEGTSYASKSATADNMMKQIIRENFGGSATDTNRTIASYLSVEADVGLGASLARSFAWNNVMDVIQDLSQATIVAGSAVYWDVAAPAYNTLEFRTYRGRRGSDKSFPDGISPVILSPERGNLGSVMRSFDYTNEATYIYAGGQGFNQFRYVASASSTDRVGQSPLNRIELFINSAQNSVTTAVDADANAALRENRPKRVFQGELVNVPGSTEYNVHWKWGDLVTVEFEGEVFNCSIDAVQIEVQDGQERILATLRAEDS